MKGFTTDLISLKYMKTRDWERFVGKVFKVQSFHGGEDHIEFVEVVEKNSFGNIVCKIIGPKNNEQLNVKLFLDRSHFDHQYIMDNYPELCI